MSVEKGTGHVNSRIIQLQTYIETFI